MSSAARRIESPDAPPPQQLGQRRSFYDAASATWLVKVLPGEFNVAHRQNEVLVTVLGSCVSACIRDRDTGVGGMNHFMLPASATGKWGDDAKSARFGNYAMEKLINELMKAGCKREALEAKVFGGGNVIQSSTLVGTSNAEFVLRYLEQEDIPCVAQDLGGNLPRRIHYSPYDGRVVRRLLNSTDGGAVARLEKSYATQFTAAPARGGDIELFE
jgi:chemotaxis protein CheD